MANTNVNITNTSPKLMALCMVLIMMNTCMSMAYQEQVAKTQKQQLEQGKKQYTLDSLRYENTLRFQDEYLKASAKQQATDSLLNVAARELGRDIRAKTNQSKKSVEICRTECKTKIIKKVLAIAKNICQNIPRNASVAQLARAQPCQG